MSDVAALVETARAERDHRLESYNRRIRGAAPDDAEAMCIDYQCWVAIAEWLETGRFYSFAAGANPDQDDAPIVKWPELEAAAEAALVGTVARIAKVEADPDQLQVEPTKRLTAEQYLEKLTDLYVRRGRLHRIHARVQLRRGIIDQMNDEFRKAREAKAKAA